MLVPATLLAEALRQAGGDDGGGFRVELAHLVAPVVVLRVGQVSVTPFSLAPRRVSRTGFHHSGPAVEPVHEVVLGGGEVRPSTQVQPYSTVELEAGRHRFALRHHHEPVGSARFESEHRRRRRLGVRVGRRGGGVRAGVVEGSEMGVGILVEGHVVVGGGKMGVGVDEIGGFGEVVSRVGVINRAVGFGILSVFFTGKHDR